MNDASVSLAVPITTCDITYKLLHKRLNNDAKKEQLALTSVQRESQLAVKMATLWVASYTVGDEGGRHVLPQGRWSQLAVLERVVLLNLRRWWRKFGRQVECTYMAAVYYELGAAAGISYLLGTMEQVAVQCPLLGGAATVDRQSWETNVLHVRWRNA